MISTYQYNSLETEDFYKTLLNFYNQMEERELQSKERRFVIYVGQGLWNKIYKEPTKEEKLNTFKQKVKQYVV